MVSVAAPRHARKRERAIRLPAAASIARTSQLVHGVAPEGVGMRRLTMHADDRGVFTEVFREEWATGIRPVQWNMVRSEARILRGVHVHLWHEDYLVISAGRATVALRDLRPGSPTEHAVALYDLCGEDLAAITIPAGVAHGFLFHEPSVHIYAVSKYWNAKDELGCHWADPALEVPWPMMPRKFSPRDAALPPLSALRGVIPAWRADGASAASD
jgi:dTDP-4-dehydrorhamnose 3,5-epimerase